MLVASLLEDVACGLAGRTDSKGLLLDAPLPEAALPWRLNPKDTTNLPGRIISPSELPLLPRLGVLAGWNPDVNAVQGPFRPTCKSEQAPNEEVDGLIPRESSGWTQWKDPNGQTKPYLVADVPGSKVVFDLDVGTGGRVEMYSMRSAGFGLGIVKCWIDDDEGRSVKVNGYWDNQWA
jgi:hypothetical protein